MATILNSYTDANYKALRATVGDPENGLNSYTHLIEDKMAPLLNTERPIDSMGLSALRSADHAIVFIHHNLSPDTHYDWLHKYRDLVLVTGIPATYSLLQFAFPEPDYHIILQPVPVDTDYISQFKAKHTLHYAYAGNPYDFKQSDLHHFLPPDTPMLTGLPHDQLLREMSLYKYIYAVGITAVEAQVLGCKLKQCDSRFPNPELTFPVTDYKDAVQNIQTHLDFIDKNTHLN